MSKLTNKEIHKIGGTVFREVMEDEGFMSEKLTLEEIKKLSNEELGTRLARLAGYEVGAAEMYYTSPEREDWRTFRLCTSLNAVAEVERVVIEKVGIDNYYDAICQTSNEQFIASARERAEASLIALQETNL